MKENKQMKAAFFEEACACVFAQGDH